MFMPDSPVVVASLADAELAVSALGRCYVAEGGAGGSSAGLEQTCTAVKVSLTANLIL
jgi:hypothetical protein